MEQLCSPNPAPLLAAYVPENLGASKATFHKKMLMPRRSRLQLEQQSLASTSPPGNQQDDSASSSQALISRLASFASAKHVPLNSVLAHLHLPPPPSATLDERHTRHLVAALAARIRCAPPTAVVAATFGELAGTPTSEIFPKKGEKDVLPRSALASAFATFLPVSADFSIPQAVDFLMYNNRNRVRVCDVEQALHPPPAEEECEDGEDTITVVEDEAENERKMQEFAEMARKIEEAEALADSAVDAGEIATVISFLDPGDDGEVDLKELEGAFRISRRDQAQEKVDLGKQQAVVDKLKAHLVELSKPIEEKSDFTDEEIDLVMNFMDPDRDGITTDEFEAGFRQARRAKASAEAELAGRATLRKLLDRIEEVHPEFEKPLDWFNLCNTNPGPPGSPVEVSGLELREGLKDLKTFAGKDIDALLKYMDPDGDCDLSVPEFESALARLAAEPASNAAAAAAGEIVVKLEVHMDEANIRMIDLFRMMDKDGEGSIEPDEMRAGLLKLAMPSGVERAKKKIKKEKAIKKTKKIMEKQEKQVQMQKRAREAEESGAAAILRQLEKRMQQKGQRMIDLFRDLDKSGDGQISHSELFDGLKELAGPTPHQRAMMKRAVEDQERRMKEFQEKQLKDAEVREHVLRSVETGAASVLNRLHAFITEGEQEKKIADIFREYDSGGEGSLSHGELAMAMDLLDMELSDAEVHAFISFVDESDDGDVDLTELDAAMKGFLRIKRVNPKFGEKTAPRMTEDEIESATAYIMQELGDEYEFKALEDLFKKNSKGKGEVEGKLGGEELKEHRKYQQWLEKSRCSKAPTGRLPSLEDTLTEAQKLEIETAKLRKKKERQVAGQVHFQSWLKKKWGEEKVKIAQTLEKEKEDLGVELPPINLLDSAKVDAVCQLVQKEGAPEECTAVRVRAAFMCFARELGIEFAAADLTAAVKTEMDSLDKGNELAHKSILTLWRKNSKDLVLKSIDKLFKEGETTSIGNFRKLLTTKLASSTKFYDTHSFTKAKEDFLKEQKKQKKKDGADAWAEWEQRKAQEISSRKRAQKKEYRELMAKQKAELEKVKRLKKEKRDKYMASLGIQVDKNASTTGSIASKGGMTQRTKKSVMTATSMSSSTTLLLCQASISPYGADPGKAYDRKNNKMREKLAELKRKKGRLPQVLVEEAENFRAGILGPIPKNYTPIIGKVIGGNGFDSMDYNDMNSIGQSTIDSMGGGDDMSLQDSVVSRKMGKRGGGGGVQEARPQRSNGGGERGGRPPRAVKAKPKNVKVEIKTGGVLGGEPVGVGGGGGGAEDEDEDEDYNDDFEDAGEMTMNISVTQAFDEKEEGVEEEEILDFFNTEAVTAELPIEVYGDDFEDDDGEPGVGFKIPLIEATPPPPGHFTAGGGSRPNTSGGGDGRPVSRSSSTESRRRPFQ